MPELMPGQRMMVEDGLPQEAILDPAERKAAWAGRKLTKVRDLKAPRKNEDPATRALRKEMARAEERKKAERFARLKQLKTEQETKAMTKTAKKAQAKKTAAKAPKTTARKPAPKKSWKARAATANARAPAGAVSDVVRKIADMMRRKGGASMAEMVAATGIEAHPMRAKIKQVRDRLGLRTEAPSKENGFRYFVRDGGGSAPAEAAESPATSG